MAEAIFRFYEELNDFLPRHRRKTDFVLTSTDKRSIKDAIESLGVPHTEIDLILVNGKSVDFKYILQDQVFQSVLRNQSTDSAIVLHLQGKITHLEIRTN